MIPTRHYGTVDRERVILLYAITSKMSIDVRAIIHQIMKLSTNNHRFGFFFFQLITTLYKKEMIPHSKGEIVIEPRELLNMAHFNELTSNIKNVPNERRVVPPSRLSIKKNFIILVIE